MTLLFHKKRKEGSEDRGKNYWCLITEDADSKIMEPYSKRFLFTWNKKSFTWHIKEPWSVMSLASLLLPATLQPDKRMSPLPYKMCYLPQQLRRALWSAQVPHENTQQGKGTMQMEPEMLKPTMWWGIEREVTWGTELCGWPLGLDRDFGERFGE